MQILFDNLFPSLPQVREGKLTALPTTMPERSFQLSPDIPTMRESAPELAKFDVSSWFGVFLPRGVPRAGARRAQRRDQGVARRATT